MAQLSELSPSGGGSVVCAVLSPVSASSTSSSSSSVISVNTQHTCTMKIQGPYHKTVLAQMNIMQGWGEGGGGEGADFKVSK